MPRRQQCMRPGGGRHVTVVLNGKKIPGPTRLQSGDQITLCGRRLTFHMTELPAEPAAAAV